MSPPSLQSSEQYHYVQRRSEQLSTQPWAIGSIALTCGDDCFRPIHVAVACLNSAFSFILNCARSTRSQRVNFHIDLGEIASPRGSCSKPTMKCTASSRTLLVAVFGSK